MNLTDAGLNQIEQYADKKELPDILLLVQILKEIREIKVLLNVLQNAHNSGDDSSCGTDDCED